LGLSVGQNRSTKTQQIKKAVLLASLALQAFLEDQLFPGEMLSFQYKVTGEDTV
jgi:hypothetical protein